MEPIPGRTEPSVLGPPRGPHVGLVEMGVSSPLTAVTPQIGGPKSH